MTDRPSDHPQTPENAPARASDHAQDTNTGKDGSGEGEEGRRGGKKAWKALAEKQKKKAKGKLPKMRMPGRPRMVETPEVFAERTLDYVQTCIKEEYPVTLTGLTLHLGFTDVQSMTDYGARPDFAGVVKHARLIVSHWYELRAATAESGGAVAGAIFALKNVAGWTDKREVEFRGVMAQIDVGKLPQDMVARIAGGEHPATVLAGALERPEVRGLLEPGQPDGEG